MKRGIVLFVLFVLLISPMVLAVEDDVINLVSNESPEQLKEGLSTLRGGLDEKTEDVLQREINIPKELNFLYPLIRGSSGKDVAITWGRLIVFTLTIFAVFVFSLAILEFTAFETDWVKYIIAGCITIFSTLTGLPYKLIDIFYKLVNNFYYVIGGLVVILVFLFILKPILAGVKNMNKISKAEELGIKAGAVLKGLSKTAESNKND